MKKLRGIILVIGCLFLGACGKKKDYGDYLDHMPKSILVLPPLNNSVDVTATDNYLSTVTKPLAEAGYYVFPVTVVNHMMKENGLPTPFEMHNVPLDKLENIFGADAVLYITIKNWGQSYHVINTVTTVSLVFKLVDIKTGTLLWQQAETVRSSSGDGQNSILGQLASAIVVKVVDSMTERDTSRPLAINANHRAFNNKKYGLIKGHRHPKYKEDQLRKINEREKLETQ